MKRNNQLVPFWSVEWKVLNWRVALKQRGPVASKQQKWKVMISTNYPIKIIHISMLIKSYDADLHYVFSEGLYEWFSECCFQATRACQQNQLYFLTEKGRLMVLMKIRPSCTLKTILEITSYDFQVNLIRPCVAFKQQTRWNQSAHCYYNLGHNMVFVSLNMQNQEGKWVVKCFLASIS